MPGFKALLNRLAPTFDFAPNARPLIEFGSFANVIPVAPNLGVAISTDGVGTKILVAEALRKFDTVGIDCVAMNVNDVICVGATPLCMVDYIAVEKADDDLLSQLGAGLAEGARQAEISIPGGELAQVAEMIKGSTGGLGFDLVGACIGTVALDRIITGRRLEAGDAIVGLASSGIHSNGLTLARRVLSDLHEYVSEFGCTVGEELLRPTTIYTKFAKALLASGVEVKAFAHITGDGFLNVTRVEAEVSFEVERLPETLAVFRVLQERGAIPDEEMFAVYNMGIGFVAVVPRAEASRTIAIAEQAGYRAFELGSVSDEPGRRVYIRPRGLVGESGRFRKA